MKPALDALKAALKRFDAVPLPGPVDRKELAVAATAAGFNHTRAIEDWSRYQVAVSEAAEQVEEPAEPARDPETREMFG